MNTEGATLEMENPHPYVDVLVDDFDSPIDDSSQAEDAVQLYRRYASMRGMIQDPDLCRIPECWLRSPTAPWPSPLWASSRTWPRSSALDRMTTALSMVALLWLKR